MCNIIRLSMLKILRRKISLKKSLLKVGKVLLKINHLMLIQKLWIN